MLQFTKEEKLKAEKNFKIIRTHQEHEYDGFGEIGFRRFLDSEKISWDRTLPRSSLPHSTLRRA